MEVKNPNYWRRDAEREAMSRKHERRLHTRVLAGEHLSSRGKRYVG